MNVGNSALETLIFKSLSIKSKEKTANQKGRGFLKDQ